MFPDRIVGYRKKVLNPTPSAISKGFGKNEEPNKNEDDPSKLDSSLH